MVCILSIVLTAPTSAIFMTVLGPHLLTKTAVPFNTEELRRSMRRMSVRSLRDLTVDAERELVVEEGKTEELPTIESHQGDTNKTKM